MVNRTRSHLVGGVVAVVALVGGWVSLVASPAWAAPVAIDDTYITGAGTPLTVAAPGVLTNDNGLPPNARATSAGPIPASAYAFSFGTDGSISYTPKQGFTGQDTFLYCVEGGGLGSCQSNPATVTFIVTTPFTPPAPTQTITGDYLGPITVTAGQSLLVTNARVVGPVTVSPGG